MPRLDSRSSQKQELRKFLSLFHQIKVVFPEHIMHNEIYREMRPEPWVPHKEGRNYS